VSLLTVAGAAVSSVAGQQPDASAPSAAPAPAAVFRSAVDLVALSVVVTDGDQRFVPGLQQSDFVVLEDGVEQDVTFFSAGNVPLDLALLLDTSASMTGQLQDVRAAARGFLQVVRDIDRVMILDLKNTTRVLHPLSGDVRAALAAVESLEAGGGTGLYNGLYLTMRQLMSARGPARDPVRRQAIVVLSDGQDNASLVSFDDVKSLARGAGIATYTIQLQSPALPRRPAHVSRVLSPEEYALRELATETGARAFFPERIEDLAGVYDRFAAELAHQYALGYTPKAQQQDGRFRRLNVQVAARPGARTRTRAGYLAQRTGT
jgi:Ca-activated chloride channel family protein